MAAAHYRDAVALYEEFVRANPQHPAAVRARAAHGALSALIETQGERDRLRAELTAREADVARLRQELGARSTESAGRTAEATRLRRDLEARQAEVDRLKADLDRLRSIDLRREPSHR
jgi:chromosome segregation ATPase